MLLRQPWTFGTNIKDRDYLFRDQPFETLAEELSAAVRAVGRPSTKFLIEPKQGQYGDHDPLLKELKCTRPAWWVRLDRPLLDTFFNGISGIRAQYYMDPYRGRRQNLLLISVLTDELIQIAAAKEPSVDIAFMRRSLAQPSAKVWISEKDIHGKKIIRASDLGLDEESIQNDWLDTARRVKSGAYPGEDYRLYSAALSGVRAPIPDQLEIKGAWITGAKKREYVTPDKRDRDCQIFMFGFS